MKTTINNSTKHIWLIFPILLATFVWAVGCVSTTNPLASWKSDGSSGYVDMSGSCQAYVEKIPYGKAVSDDVENFIKKLPIRRGRFADRSESYWIHEISLFEDGTGQHAVQIEIDLNGTYLNYVLIYDKKNNRVKVKKYSSGNYRS
jgi:hypothetical protein